MISYSIELFIIYLISLSVLVVPVVRFLYAGWSAKRNDILNSFDEEACIEYFQMYCKEKIRYGAKERLTKLYDKQYGRNRYVWPIIELSISATLASLTVLITAFDAITEFDAGLVKIDLTGAAALCGAYLWSVNEFISRSRSLDLSPDDVQWCSARFLIAMPIGYAFGQLVNDQVAPFLAFALAAVPMQSLMNLLRKISHRMLQVEEKFKDSRDGIERLQGVDQTVAERLAKQDLRTIVQLAYCDPVHITMRSNLSFNFITDLMAQSLAWLYLEKKMANLRVIGLRSAVEISHVIHELDSAEQESTNAPNTLQHAANLIGISTDEVEFTFRQISGDPYTRFLFEIWTDPRADSDQDLSFSFN